MEMVHMLNLNVMKKFRIIILAALVSGRDRHICLVHKREDLHAAVLTALTGLRNGLTRKVLVGDGDGHRNVIVILPADHATLYGRFGLHRTGDVLEGL